MAMFPSATWKDWNNSATIPEYSMDETTMDRTLSFTIWQNQRDDSTLVSIFKTKFQNHMGYPFALPERVGF
jgi:hypothetical protein